jgi:hypothetical protein
MKKQREYEIRKKISTNINCRVQKEIKKYYKHYQNDIGMLLYYPLILMEKKFKNAEPLYICAEPDRIATGWFLKELMNIGYKERLEFTFNEDDFFMYENVEYPSIKKLHNDAQLANHIMDMKSMNKIVIEESSPGKFDLYRAQIHNTYPKEAIYFLGIDDEDRYEQERNLVNEYLAMKYLLNYLNISTIKKLDAHVDVIALNLSTRSAEVDIRKLGMDLCSEVINKYQELSLVLGYFKYLSFINLLIYNLRNLRYRIKEWEWICCYSQNWIIKKMKESTGLSKDTIQKYLEYFSFNTGKGSFCEFPLIKYDGKIFFNPSSFILNDFQFSIVNGHYSKNIVISNRQDTVSDSIIRNIVEQLKPLSNILNFTNQGYSFIGLDGKYDGEIDVGIYDVQSQYLLILECKWKDNVFVPEENYKAIEDTVNKIYKQQLMKHKKFIQVNKNNIKKCFKQEDWPIINIDVDKIFYFAIDKRCQFHTQDQHLLSIYLFLYLIKKHMENSKLNLQDIIDEIQGMETTSTKEKLKTLKFKSYSLPDVCR